MEQCLSDDSCVGDTSVENLCAELDGCEWESTPDVQKCRLKHCYEFVAADPTDEAQQTAAREACEAHKHGPRPGACVWANGVCSEPLCNTFGGESGRACDEATVDH